MAIRLVSPSCADVERAGVSQGYGRRMRFLIWDDSNGKLVGLLALADPVFNLAVRDQHIGWTAGDRRKRLAHVLDAYVLGAIPPYNMLLGGKLVAALVGTREIRDAFARKYAGVRGLISGEVKPAALAMVTTSSALGRSSVYNRLRLGNYRVFRSVGYTSGWGHFHIPDRLFATMRHYLKAHGHPYADNHRYGDGPNWKLRAVRECLRLLGLNRVTVPGTASSAHWLPRESTTRTSSTAAGSSLSRLSRPSADTKDTALTA